jgi:hypothetical protein
MQCGVVEEVEAAAPKRKKESTERGKEGRSETPKNRRKKRADTRTWDVTLAIRTTKSWS